MRQVFFTFFLQGIRVDDKVEGRSSFPLFLSTKSRQWNTQKIIRFLNFTHQQQPFFGREKSGGLYFLK